MTLAELRLGRVMGKSNHRSRQWDGWLRVAAALSVPFLRQAPIYVRDGPKSTEGD